MAAAQNMAITTTQKIIAIAVTIIIISTVAIPVIDDLQKSIVTLENNTTQTFFVGSSSNAEIIITWNDSGFTVNGEQFSGLGMEVPILISDNLTLSYLTNGTILAEDVNKTTDFRFDLSSTNTTLTISNGTYTTSSSITGSVSGDVLCIAKNGTYGAFKSTSFYVNDDSKIYSTYYTSLNSKGIRYNVGGTVSDLKVTGALYEAGPTVVTSSMTANFTSSQVNSINEITKEVVNGQYHVVLNDGGVYYDSTVTDVTWFAPIEYKTITASDESMINLIGIIPILLILVPLMMAVRMMALKRN